MKRTDAEFVAGELAPHEFDGYDEAYYLGFDGEEIWLGKAMDDGHDNYIYFDCDVCFVEKEYYDKFIKTNEDANVIKFSYDMLDNNKSDCDLSDNDNLSFLHIDEDQRGFRVHIDNDNYHKEFKYKGNKKLTEKEIADIIGAYLF